MDPKMIKMLNLMRLPIKSTELRRQAAATLRLSRDFVSSLIKPPSFQALAMRKKTPTQATKVMLKAFILK